MAAVTSRENDLSTKKWLEPAFTREVITSLTTLSNNNANAKVLGDLCFDKAAPKLWDALLYKIRSSPSLLSLKVTLRTF